MPSDFSPEASLRTLQTVGGVSLPVLFVDCNGTVMDSVWDRHEALGGLLEMPVYKRFPGKLTNTMTWNLQNMFPNFAATFPGLKRYPVELSVSSLFPGNVPSSKTSWPFRVYRCGQATCVHSHLLSNRYHYLTLRPRSNIRVGLRDFSMKIVYNKITRKRAFITQLFSWETSGT